MSLYPRIGELQDDIRAQALTSIIQPVGKLMVKKFATGMHESWFYDQIEPHTKRVALKSRFKVCALASSILSL